MTNSSNILISRTDSIGDVVLTLPICAWIKEHSPESKIYFLGNTYTLPVLDCYPSIDQVIDWNTIQQLPAKKQIEYFQQLEIDTCIHVFPNKTVARLMKKAKIQNRVGTSHRLFHLFTCNIRPNFSRKKSNLHESQLNFELLRPLGLTEIPTLEQIQHYLSKFKAHNLPLPIELPEGKKIILHPKSKGSAVEWPIFKYISLAEKLADKGYHIYFTGTEKEALYFRDKIPNHPMIHDVSGKFTLPELITFISKCDAIVACSTGPLHIGAISGIRAVGIYSRTRPIHPERWRPIGEKVLVLTNQKEPMKGTISSDYVMKIAVDSIVDLFVI